VVECIKLSGIHTKFHPTVIGCIFFSSVHGTFSRKDHAIGHKTVSKNCKKIKITLIIFSEHSAIKIKINTKKNFGNYANPWICNKTFEQPMNQGSNQETNYEILHKWK
jgi:hypothetical protein